MDIIESLLNHDEWLRFKDYKIGGGHLTSREEKELSEFIDKKLYLIAAQKLNSGGFFGIPEAVKVNKSSSSKKERFLFSAMKRALFRNLSPLNCLITIIFLPTIFILSAVIWA